MACDAIGTLQDRWRYFGLVPSHQHVCVLSWADDFYSVANAVAQAIAIHEDLGLLKNQWASGIWSWPVAFGVDRWHLELNASHVNDLNGKMCLVFTHDISYVSSLRACLHILP